MTTLGKEGVEAAISIVVARWHGRDVPKVRVVDDIVDIPERARFIATDTDGVFDSETATAYLIGNRITTAKQARRTLAREVINHYSLMQILGGGLRTSHRGCNPAYRVWRSEGKRDSRRRA